MSYVSLRVKETAKSKLIGFATVIPSCLVLLSIGAPHLPSINSYLSNDPIVNIADYSNAKVTAPPILISRLPETTLEMCLGNGNTGKSQQTRTKSFPAVEQYQPTVAVGEFVDPMTGHYGKLFIRLNEKKNFNDNKYTRFSLEKMSNDAFATAYILSVKTRDGVLPSGSHLPNALVAVDLYDRNNELVVPTGLEINHLKSSAAYFNGEIRAWNYLYSRNYTPDRVGVTPISEWPLLGFKGLIKNDWDSLSVTKTMKFSGFEVLTPQTAGFTLKVELGGKYQEIQFLAKRSSVLGGYATYGPNGLSMELQGRWNMVNHGNNNTFGTDRVYLTSTISIPVESITLKFNAKVANLTTSPNQCPFMK